MFGTAPYVHGASGTAPYAHGAKYTRRATRPSRPSKPGKQLQQCILVFPYFGKVTRI